MQMDFQRLFDLNLSVLDDGKEMLLHLWHLGSAIIFSLHPIQIHPNPHHACSCKEKIRRVKDDRWERKEKG